MKILKENTQKLHKTNITITQNLLIDDNVDFHGQVKMLDKVVENDIFMDEIPRKTYTKWFDYDKIKSGFCIRNRENGDFLISDCKGHHKKLKSYFIDEKIPLEQRDAMWLLAQDAHVLWLVGGRMSEDVKVLADTKTVIEIHYIGGK